MEVFASLCTIIALVYTVFIGQRTLPELLSNEGRRRKKYFRFTEKLRSFWGFGNQSTVDIICSSIPSDVSPDFANPSHRNYLRYAKFADLDTLIVVHANLARLFPSLIIRDFTSEEHLAYESENVIIIGGPPLNVKSKHLQDHLPYSFLEKPLGEDDPLVVNRLPDYIFCPKWSNEGSLLSDISLFARLRYAHSSSIYILAGCLTTGVLGAAKSMLTGTEAFENIDFVSSRVGEADFVVIFETRRHAGIISSHSFRMRSPLVLMMKINSEYEIIEENASGYRSIS
jgi:hypothetical protein